MRPFRDPYRWYDPFEMVEEMANYVLDHEQELDQRLRWALVEAGRHRSMVDDALHTALQKYAPVQLEHRAASMIIDQELAANILRGR